MTVSHTGGMTQSFVYEVMRGTHDLENDALYCALFEWDDQLRPTTQQDEDATAYDATHEVTGPGYTAGGVLITSSAIIKKKGSWVFPIDDIIFPANTVSANDALIYNSSQGNKSIAWLRFSGVLSTINATFEIRWAPEQLPIISFRL